ncbi:MAG: exosome complex protein Rrp42 [Methanosarcinaceae archaeon]|nr:exosome complex protein Rrp42 [Methanosarcinaceae archaeon]
MSDEVISILKRDRIHNLAIEGKRSDGRAFDEFRSITLKTNVIQKAEGSAYVEFGDTKVIVGIKLQKAEPFSDSPGLGIIMTGMELNPIASPSFEAGPPRENAIEMSRIVDRGIRESKAIDLEKLCIKEGELVWMIFIDISILNDAGNILDASCLAAIAALKTTVIPDDEETGFKSIPMPIQDLPVGVTLVDVGGNIIVDPTLDEELVCQSRVSIIVNENGEISGMQKGGSEPFTFDEIYDMYELAVEKCNYLRETFIRDIALLD